ncbi:MAG: hypothetical protein IJN67_02545 [Oscillospiraceae bacterium]|nr:hypothetical protein [Oscillospiraceae bacterium]
MKKIISLMIVVMLLISCIPAAFAAENSLGVTSTQGLPGETVTVTVYYNVVDASDVGLKINFGGLTCLNPMGAFTPSAAAGFFASGDSQASFIKIGTAGTENTSYSGSYAVQLAIPADAVPGTVYTLGVDDGYIANVDGDDVAYANGGTVTVIAPETEPTETEPTETEPTETEPTETEPTETEPTETEPTETEPTETETVPPVTENPNVDDEPKTGDITPHIVMSVAAVIAVAAAAMFVFKRKAA